MGSPAVKFRNVSMICGFNYGQIFGLSFAERFKTEPYPKQRIV